MWMDCCCCIFRPLYDDPLASESTRCVLSPRGVGVHTQERCGHRGGLQFSSRPYPPWRGRAGLGRGGGAKNFSILGAFWNSPFHSEHFEYTQVE